MEAAIRLGMLGCGSVGDYAVLAPARDDDAIIVSAVASRDLDKARTHAERHGIAHAFGGYQALLDARIVDAIYIALPNALHRRWVIAALEAGYPVLCEKPIATSVEDAAAMVAAAQAANLPLVEAFHWRHHPLAARTAYWLDSGAIGTVRRIDTHFHIAASFLAPDNIRMDPALGGGSTLDQGCYCVDLLRYFGKADPILLSAQAQWSDRGVDLAMDSQLRFPDGRDASISTAMNAPGSAIRSGATFHGTGGTLVLDNPFLPHLGSSITITTAQGTTIETPTVTPSYIFQARAFAGIVRNRALAVDSAAMMGSMRIIWAIFAAAHAHE